MTGFTQTIHLNADLALADSLVKQSSQHHEKRPYISKGEPITFANRNPVSFT